MKINKFLSLNPFSATMADLISDMFCWKALYRLSLPSPVHGIYKNTVLGDFVSGSSLSLSPLLHDKSVKDNARTNSNGTLKNKR
jgi:hypothetical protein